LAPNGPIHSLATTKKKQKDKKKEREGINTWIKRLVLPEKLTIWAGSTVQLDVERGT